MNNIQPLYRPDIDGLRGIAVLSVVLYHMFPNTFTSGFVGVDIFFVISGFLITQIILTHLHNQSFRFSRFYANRIRRIFPALLIVLLFLLIFASGMFLSNEFALLSKHIAGASIFISNFILWNESGYFDATAITKPLLHLWSLGIEEQFYLFWPLVLWLTWKRPKILILTLTLLLIGSFYLNIHNVIKDSSGTYYSPLTRAWELFLGAALSVTFHYRQTKLVSLNSRAIKPAMRFIINSLACIATAAIIFSIFKLKTKEDFGFPGWWATIPTIGTAYLIAMGSHNPVSKYVLQCRPLVWIGLISYPLYLWHWPLLSVAHIIDYNIDGIKFILIVLSVFLAWLTYAILERPIRFGSRFKNSKVACLIAAMVTIGILGILGNKGYLYFNNDKDMQTFIKDCAWTYKDTPRFKPVTFNPNEFEGGIKLRADLDKYQAGGSMFFREIPSQYSRKTLFIGDSQMEQYWSRIDQLILDHPQKARTAIFITASAFLPITNVLVNPELRPHFVGLADAMVNYALSDKNIDTIVISTAWDAHLYDMPNLPEKDESLYYVLIDKMPQHLHAGRPANDVAMLHLSNMIKTLRTAGKRVFLVLTHPGGGGSLNWHRTWGKVKLTNTPIEKSEFQKKKESSLRQRLFQIARESGAEIIDPYPALCPNMTCSGIYDGSHPVYMDVTSHLSDPYTRKYATYMDKTLLD